MNGKSKATASAGERAAKESPAPAAPSVRKSAVAKVSHTLSVELAERLEAFAFFQRVSESAVIEHSLQQFFGQGDDTSLGDVLRRGGAGRRRKL
jgi:hypothetical protein